MLFAKVEFFCYKKKQQRNSKDLNAYNILSRKINIEFLKMEVFV